MPKIEGAKGICRLCFEPVWNDQKSVISKSGFYYHDSCTVRILDLDDWEKNHRNPSRNLGDTKTTKR